YTRATSPGKPPRLGSESEGGSVRVPPDPISPQPIAARPPVPPLRGRGRGVSRTATIACLAGAGTAPELMAEAALALQAVARVHGLSVEDVHAPYGAVAVARAGQPFPPSTRSAVLAADAVLVA